MGPSLFLLCVSLAVALWTTKQDRLCPLTWSSWSWVVIAAIQGLGLLSIASTSWESALVISVGVVALAYPLGFAHSEMRESPDLKRVSIPDFSQPRTVFLALVVLALLSYGSIAFQDSIASIAGSNYADLTFREIRAAQVNSARESGLGGLLFSLSPLLACVGLLGMRMWSRGWVLLLLLSAFFVVQSPSRTNGLGTLAVALVFWLYIRRRGSGVRPMFRRIPIWVWFSVVAGGGLVYFLAVGDELQKNDFGVQAVEWLPAWSVGPMLYFVGGVSALAVALDQGLVPSDWGATIYFPLRVLEVFTGVAAPNTISEGVYAPMWFNVFTGFGALYFDFGFFGVIVGSLALGAVVVVSHRKALQGRVEWAWVTACLSGTLLSLPLTYRVLNVDILFQIAFGVVVFRLMRSPVRRRGGAIPATSRRRQHALRSTRA